MNKSIIILLLTWPFLAFGSHNRAGEITYEKLDNFNYNFTVTTYTSSAPGTGDDPIIEVVWGDGTSDLIQRDPPQRANVPIINGFYQLNKYYANHTFPGPGVYEVFFQSPNRNRDIVNIPNSDAIFFSLQTTIVVNEGIEENTAPFLLNPPVDLAAVGHVFIHNPVAYDVDGDSISYNLTESRGESGELIDGYVLPRSQNVPVYIDPFTGNFIWDTPEEVGSYNVALYVNEWRNGFLIGRIIRDMQIEVVPKNNTPPVTENIDKYCVLSGESVVFQATSTDADGDFIEHEFIGGPFEISDPPQTQVLAASFGSITSQFSWTPGCDKVRSQPYNLILKATDVNDNFPLVDITNFFIQVIGRPPENLSLKPTFENMTITWDMDDCEDVVGYRVYRKVDSSEVENDPCSFGAPSGYELIGETKQRTDTSFLDLTIVQGDVFCYKVVAVYENGTLSKPSEQICGQLLPGSPLMMQTSVEAVSEGEGKILLSWLQPSGLDTLSANGPYELIVSRKIVDGPWEEIYVEKNHDLSDTTFVDSLLNTLLFPYSYQVAIYNDSTNNRFIVGKPETSNTMFLSATPSSEQIVLNVTKYNPWVNIEYDVYRGNEQGGLKQLIGSTNLKQYIDLDIKHDSTYCYQFESKGERRVDDQVYANMNWSHEYCITYIDSFPPCVPNLSLASNCDAGDNSVTWASLEGVECARDFAFYKLYYKPWCESEYQLIYETGDILDTSYIHEPDEWSGCYYIAVEDLLGNESTQKVLSCFGDDGNSCFGFSLPNVFTPNNDGVNDMYVSDNPFDRVQKVDMKIFNRYGKLVHVTEDANINWDGTDKDTGQPVSTGVYYYVCDVFEPCVEMGDAIRSLVGFVHVYATDADLIPK